MQWARLRLAQFRATRFRVEQAYRLFRMFMRLILVSACVAACVLALAMASRQRQEIKQLRTEQKQLTTEVESAAQAATSAARTPQSAALQSGPPIELLELRGEVTRLKSRQRELAAARTENEQLQAQLAAKRTNTAAATPTLPPGYILKSRAQWRGFNTPDATLESFLWAAQNRDLTNLLQTFTPEMAEKVAAEFQRPGRSLDDFFQGANAVPGMRVVGRTQEAADRVTLQVEMMPGMDARPEPMRLRLINGQWKMEMR